MDLLLKIISLTVLVLSCTFADDSPSGKVHALLVAGSNGWWNYRHQADVAHAYHILLNHGFEKENIIVMMYDDIANNTENPYPGELYNSPNKRNVYEGLEIDYKGDAVTSWNFLAVLRGDAKAVKGGNGRVINRQAVLIRTSDDRIFVYFSDHGSTGLIAFPVGRLTAKRLNEALLTMHKQHQFKQLVFYLEACESGSMFKDILRKNINVYAVTAANEEESSYAAYCDNILDLPCLGDEFSVNWMEDTDAEDTIVETLDEQYQFVRDVTEGSHVMNYGNLSIANEPVGWFLGTKNPYMKRESSKPKHKKVLWPSRDVELMHLEKIKLLHPQSAAVDLQISRIKKNRNDIEALFKNLIDFLVTEGSERRFLLERRSSVENLDCHDEVVEAFDSICIDIDKHDYALKYMNVLNNLCTKFNDPAKIINAMRTICLNTHSQLI